jgi:hypothetical protein
MSDQPFNATHWADLAASVPLLYHRPQRERIPVTTYRERLKDGVHDAKKQAKQQAKDAASWDTPDKGGKEAKGAVWGEHADKTTARRAKHADK